MRKIDADRVKVGEVLHYAGQPITVVKITQRRDYHARDVELIGFPLFRVQDAQGKYSNITYRHKTLKRVKQVPLAPSDDCALFD